MASQSHRKIVGVLSLCMGVFLKIKEATKNKRVICCLEDIQKLFDQRIAPIWIQTIDGKDFKRISWRTVQFDSKVWKYELPKDLSIPIGVLLKLLDHIESNINSPNWVHITNLNNLTYSLYSYYNRGSEEKKLARNQEIDQIVETWINVFEDV